MQDKNEVVKRDASLAIAGTTAEDTFDKMLAMGDKLMKTGFLPPTIKTGAQAAAIILRGRELGLGVMESLTTLNIIKNKPTVPPQTMLAMAYKKIPGFGAQCIKSTAEIAVWKFKRPGTTHEQTFTLDDAQKLGLTGKDNYVTQAKTMLNWRCIAAGMRLIAPDVVHGVYTPEEMDPNIVIVDADSGEVEVPKVETPKAEETPGQESAVDAAVEPLDEEARAFEDLGGDGAQNVPTPPPAEGGEASTGHRTFEELLDVIKHMGEVYVNLHGEEVWINVLKEASGFKDKETGEMVGYVESLDDLKSYIMRNQDEKGDKVRKRISIIAHKLEDAWNNAKGVDGTPPLS